MLCYDNVDDYDSLKITKCFPMGVLVGQNVVLLILEK